MMDRFWDKVQRRGPDECWPWLAAKDEDGYGVFGMKVDGRHYNLKAHRVAFFFTHGYWPTPMGLHGCDNPPCCNAENPLHVHEGTGSQNNREKFARSRQASHQGPGELNANARLTWAEAGLIRAFYAGGGITQNQIAAEFGISQAAVSHIVRGISWRES